MESKSIKTISPQSDSRSTMEHLNSVAVMSHRNSGSVYMTNDISAEAVISDLSLFRTTTPLPLWNGITSSSSTGSQGLNYSIVSNLTTTSTASTVHPSQEPSVPNSHSSAGVKAVRHSFEAFTDCSREEPSNSIPLSPHTSFSESGNLSTPDTPNSSDIDDSDQPCPKRKKRTPVPDERKDAKYWDRRKKNNDAAKRSRDIRRKKIDGELKSAKDAIQENQKLKQEIDVLKAEINSLRRLLKDANTTLSLWIRARQAAEPTAQLPPMLRPNVSFVNFSASSTT